MIPPSYLLLFSFFSYTVHTHPYPNSNVQSYIYSNTHNRLHLVDDDRLQPNSHHRHQPNNQVQPTVSSPNQNESKKDETVSGNELSSMYQLQESVPLPKREGRLQGVSVKGRLVCGSEPIVGGRVKIVDIDKRPDKDDLMGDVQTGEDGQFHISGATREQTDIEVMLKIYHDCLDGDKPCQRKVTWRVPKKYYNNGTFTEWFNIGTVNMELIFNGEERDCRH